MHWALFGGGKAKNSGGPNNAVRLHLSFHLLEDKPAAAYITDGKTCERKTLKAQWERGAAGQVSRAATSAPLNASCASAMSPVREAM